MNTVTKHRVLPSSSEPRRPLRANFTKQTLRYAVVAKRRAQQKQRFTSHMKEIFTMKKLKFLRTVPGAALAVAVIAGSTVGAYALNNWFNGGVDVKQTDSSILSVDLSACKQGTSILPVEPSSDLHHIQFKILGNPHISADALQTKLLASCEYNAVREFYKSRPASASDAFIQSSKIGNSYSQLVAGTVTASETDGTITLSYVNGLDSNKEGTAGRDAQTDKSFRLAANVTIYDQGQSVNTHDLRVGDPVVFEVTYPAGYVMQEGVDGIATLDTVQSIFKTKYSMIDAPGTSKAGFTYDANNIMPLTMYNQLHK